MSKIIEMNQLAFTYAKGSPYEHKALKNISFDLEQGEFLGIFGPNGSGKSTLAQQFNGLLSPGSGTVRVCGMNTDDAKQRRWLWKKVSLVFQYPEQQIFQITVFDEVAYGPRNLGLAENEVKIRVRAALQEVGLIPEDIINTAPASLSGGMKRRIAIAGMLAMLPELLILDEPMAGLDATGRKLILEIIRERQLEQKSTVMISHDLKEIIHLADKIAILDEGSLAFYGTTEQLLKDPDILSSYCYELPAYLQLLHALTEKGLTVNKNIRSIKEASQEIARLRV